MDIPKLIEENKKFFMNYIKRKFTSGDQYLAEDLFHDAVYKALKNGRYKPDYKFTTWFTTVIRNTYIDQYRKGKLNVIDIDSLRENSEGNSAFENLLEGHSDNEFDDRYNQEEELDKAIDKLLTPKQKQILRLSLNGYHYYEISEITDMPEGTVKSFLWRSKQILIEHFKKEQTI